MGVALCCDVNNSYNHKSSREVFLGKSGEKKKELKDKKEKGGRKERKRQKRTREGKRSCCN